MRSKIISYLLVGAAAANADILSSTQRFFDQGDEFTNYSEDESGRVDGFEVGEVPYSPADSDLGVQEVLVEREDVAPVIFRFSNAIFRTDNAAGNNFFGDEPSWISSSRASVTWRPHLINGWFADFGVAMDFLRFEDDSAIDYENYSGRAGIYKNFPDLDDTVFFARFEYQSLNTGSLFDSNYDAQRIRLGLQKTLYAASRQRMTAGLSAAYEWAANPDRLQRDEIEVNLTYRYAFCDDVYTLVTVDVSRFDYQDFGREDLSYGLGLEVAWEMTKNLRVSASVTYDKNDSNSPLGANDFQSWTGGVGLGCQVAF